MCLQWCLETISHGSAVTNLHFPPGQQAALRAIGLHARCHNATQLGAGIIVVSHTSHKLAGERESGESAWATQWQYVLQQAGYVLSSSTSDAAGDSLVLSGFLLVTLYQGPDCAP